MRGSFGMRSDQITIEAAIIHIMDGKVGIPVLSDEENWTVISVSF